MAEAEKEKKPLDLKKVVKVKNISNKIINTSFGSIEPDKVGEATLVEARQLHKFLKTAK